MITLKQLSDLMPHARAHADAYLDPLNAAMEEHGVAATNQRQAMFLAQVAHESAELNHVVENLNYSAGGLLLVFGKHFSKKEANDYARQPERIANRVYANRMGNGDANSGDGWRYRGRGLIQLTGRTNYERCGAALGVDLVGEPDLLLEPAHAAMSAAWFYDGEKQCNEDADIGDIERVTRKINGGLNGLEERRRYYVTALGLLS